MLSVTQHRGRDGRLTYVEPMDGVALAYCHSAAFGQRKGSPTWQEDAGAVAAVDGDIYDTPAHLQGRLPSVGSPDANAVIATWESDAANFPGKLDGFFSLFLWDKKEKTLVLCTDPMGHKLVYYYEEPERGLVVFSTELKTVLAHPAVPRQLDEAILPLHLAAGLTPAPFTLAKGVRTMQPAECLTFSPDEANAKRYWLPTLEAGPDEVDYWATRTRSELREAVGRIAGGADNVAVYLSGESIHQLS